MNNNEYEYLFDDSFDKEVKFTETTKSTPANKAISGNTRLAKGLYRTTSEQEKYKKESLERVLP